MKPSDDKPQGFIHNDLCDSVSGVGPCNCPNASRSSVAEIKPLPNTEDAVFLRAVVSKPFDAVTVLEFMQVWGIAQRSLAVSATAESELAEALAAVLQHCDYTSAGETDFERAVLKGRAALTAYTKKITRGGYVASGSSTVKP